MFDWKEVGDGRTVCRPEVGENHLGLGCCMTVRYKFKKWRSSVAIFSNDAPANHGWLQIHEQSYETKSLAMKHAEQALVDFAGSLNRFTYYELNPVP